MEIKADNYQVLSVLDILTGELEFKALTKSFYFDLSVLDNYFTRNAIQSDQFQEILFKGRIFNFDKSNFKKDGTYNVVVKGMISVNGEPRITEAKGVIRVEGSKISGDSNFVIMIEEESVKRIDVILKDKLPGKLGIDSGKIGISRKIEINVKSDYKQFK